MPVINIRELRELTHPRITQAELAKRIGKDQAQVSRYEDDPGRIPLDVLLMMLQVLGVEPAGAFRRLMSDEGAGIDVGHPFEELFRNVRVLNEFIESGAKKIKTLPTGGPKLDELRALSTSLKRKPSVAIFGPFDSGKSTILNSLLGQKHLPTKYQPTTTVPTYVRHLDSRPGWMSEQVWMMGRDFNPLLWEDEEHCRQNKLVSGGIETLRDFGTHDGTGIVIAEVCYAMAFIDAPVLNACDLIDLPGFENDTGDTERAKSNPIQVDIAVYTGNAVGFMTGAGLLRLSQIIRSLPTYEKGNSGFPVLGNLFVLATHADPEKLTDEDVTEILDRAGSRAWRQLEDALGDRTHATGRPIRLEDLRNRMFTFYAQSANRRSKFETGLKDVIGAHLPPIWNKKAEDEVMTYKKSAKGYLKALMESYQKMLEDLANAEAIYDEAIKKEPERKQKLAIAHKRVTSNIKSYRQESLSHLEEHYEKVTDAKRLASLIEGRFNDKKDAQQNAAAFVFEQIQNGVENKTTRLADKLTKDVNEFLEGYSAARFSIAGEKSEFNIPFNADGAFIGGLVGLAGIGALAAWAATLGNLGAYIIAAKAVGLLSALGISIGGGTAGVMALIAAIGGPLVIGVGIIAIFAIVGYALLGPSWQERLAKKISTEFNKKNVIGQFKAALEGYWNHTRDGFDEGANAVETDFENYLEDLKSLVKDKTAGKDQLIERIQRIELAQDFFAGIPWRSKD